MKNVKIIGLTGNIGSGKSTVARLLAQHGWPVFDSDKAAKPLLESTSPVFVSIIDLFGPGILDEQGEINRGKLASVVFEKPEKIEQLNNIIHPAVKTVFDRWYQEQNTPFVVRETALLFETGIDKSSLYNIVVACPLEERIRRVMLRNNITREQVLEREKNQWEEKEKIAKADFVITNFQRPLIPQVMDLIRQLESDRNQNR